MPEETQEYEHKSGTHFLSKDFIDNAPTNQGLTVLSNYLLNNLDDEVLAESRELAYDEQSAKMTASMLKWYVTVKRYFLREPDEKSRQGLDHVLGYAQELFVDPAIGLAWDKKAIDYLMEKSHSVPSHGWTKDTIIGEARRISPKTRDRKKTT